MSKSEAFEAKVNDVQVGAEAPASVTPFRAAGAPSADSIPSVGIYCTNIYCTNPSFTKGSIVNMAELLWHMEVEHAALWVCKEPLDSKTPSFKLVTEIRQCARCNNQQQYSSYRHAAEHLWTMHFHKQTDGSVPSPSDNAYNQFTKTVVPQWILDVSQVIFEGAIGGPGSMSTYIYDHGNAVAFQPCKFFSAENIHYTEPSPASCGVISSSVSSDTLALIFTNAVMITRDIVVI